MTPDAVEVFESARPRLTGRAYRLLGVLGDADDVVQDAWLRWNSADHGSIDNPDAWLNTTVTRLALDRLRARKRAEAQYVGPWLPTPLIERTVDPSELAEVADSLSTAFLIMLEQLTPDERVAFLMADVFGERFDDIAAATGRTPASCRQLASRARRKVREAGDVRRDGQRSAPAVVERFLVALAVGDAQAALGCLAPDAVYVGDGGAARRAARRVVVRPERIVRLLTNLHRRFGDCHEIEPAVVGGAPGLVIRRGSRTVCTLSVEVAHGRIVRITSVLNPDKLAALDRAAVRVE